MKSDGRKITTSVFTPSESSSGRICETSSIMTAPKQFLSFVHKLCTFVFLYTHSLTITLIFAYTE